MPEDHIGPCFVVVVAYMPDPDSMSELLQQLRAVHLPSIVVDNAPGEAGQSFVQMVRAADAEYLSAGGNRGIAWAHNAGIAMAKARGAGCVLILDQDSTVTTEFLTRLVSVAKERFTEDARTAAVSGAPVDVATGTALVYEQSRFRMRIQGGGSAEANSDSLDYNAPFLLASGTVILSKAFDAIGPFREDFFIDHVDREWGMRARSRGFVLRQILDLPMEHALGDSRGETRLRRELLFRHQNAERDYYLKRNTVLMVRTGVGPLSWRVGEVAFALGSALSCIATDRGRAKLMLLGLLDGFRGRGGPLLEARRRG
jgi:rhamnosyltransferase